MFATISRVTALTLFLLASGAAQAQGSGGTPAETFPWTKVVQIVDHFEEIAPQPPPLETVLLGTFDATTGDFIWGPTIELWEVPVDLHYDDIAVGPAFELRGIRPLAVDLAPQISGLSSIGGSAQVALQGQGPGALAKPGGSAGKSKGKGKLPGNVDTQALPGASQGQRFRGHPLDTGVMRTHVLAAKIAFVVEVVNRQPEQGVVLSIDGSTVNAAADLVDVIVQPRTRHSFEIRSASKVFADKLLVFRPPQIGTFTITALPVAIVYEPPGGTGCTQTYTSVHRAGTVIRSFQTSESGATEPVDTPITTLNEWCDIASAVGGVAQSIPNPYVAGAGTVVSGASDALRQAFGSLSISEEVSSTVTETHTLALEVTEGNSTWTQAGLGPGQGDAYYYLIEPTFAWIVAQDYQSGAVYVSTALLGQHGVGRCTARDLRQHTVALLPAEMQDQLLALDLLAPEYKAPGKKLESFSASRFKWGAPREVPLDAPLVTVTAGAPGGFWLTHEVSTSDEHVQVDVTTTTTKSTAGFLSYITNAVPKDEDSRMSLKQGRSNLSSTSDAIEVNVELVLAAGSPNLSLEVGYDRLFGTFTFREIESQPQFMSGSVSDGSGAPLGSEPMLLTFPDGRSMQARTDKQGKFSIRPPLKVAGPILVQSGGARTTVDWTGAARTGVDLHGASAQAATGSKKTKSSGKGLPDPKTVPVTASEGSTAGAIRGKPGSGARRSEAELLAEIDRLEKKVQELTGRLASLEGGAAKPAPAGVRKSKGAGPLEIVPDPTLKGRLGRLVVKFPEAAKVPACPIEIFAGETQAASVYGSLSKDLLAGEYTLKIQGRLVERVEVRAGHVSNVQVGALRLQGAEGTEFQLFEIGSKKSFFDCYGPQDVGLPPGEIEVGIAGQRVKVEIVAGQVVEF